MQIQAYPPRPELFGDASRWLSYVQVLLILLGVVCLCVVVLRLAGPRLKALRASHSGPIRVLARYALEPRRTIYVIEAAGQIMMVACSESGMTYLTELDPGNWSSLVEAETKGPKS